MGMVVVCVPATSPPMVLVLGNDPAGRSTGISMNAVMMQGWSSLCTKISSPKSYLLLLQAESVSSVALGSTPGLMSLVDQGVAHPVGRCADVDEKSHSACRIGVRS